MYKFMPPYFGSWPPNGSNGQTTRTSYPTKDTRPFAGWFFYLLPFVEQGAIYDTTMAQIAADGYNYPYGGSSTAGGTTTTVTRNDGTTYTYTNGAGATGQTQTGIWANGIRQMLFSILRCPSDGSVAPGALTPGGWGPTNYLANWHTLSNSIATWDGSTLYNPNWSPGNLGYYSPAQKFVAISDGLSNTILFAEGYATCEGQDRIALYSANGSNFGLTNGIPAGTSLTGAVSGTFNNSGNGIPNIFMFQVQPLQLTASTCPPGGVCCDSWAAQTPHTSLNIALCDGSVRSVLATITQASWAKIMLPRDGLGTDSNW
jgi:hypothetical protein